MKSKDRSTTKTIIAVGDVNPCRDLASSLMAQDLEHKQLVLDDLFTGADLVVGNLEGPITDSRQLRTEQIWNLNVPPCLAPLLSGFDGFSLANNHIFDFGEDGFVDTIDSLAEQGVQHCGAGLNAQEAVKPALFDLDGFIVSMIGITDRNWHPSGPNSPGVAIWDDQKTAETIGALAVNTDFVIVQVHQGYEFVDYPGPEELDIASRAIDAGADLVLGHHSHYVMGISRKGTSAIAYGLGDFLLDKMHIPKPYRQKSRNCVLFRFEITTHEVLDWSIKPFVSDEFGWPIPATGDQEISIRKHFRGLCEVLTDRDETLRQFRSQAGKNMLPYALNLLARLYRQDGIKATLNRLSRVRMVDLTVLFSTLYRLIKAKIVRQL